MWPALPLIVSVTADGCRSERRVLFSTGRYHCPGLKPVNSLKQISCPSGLTEMEAIMEETLGIPAKHLQCAAVQILALNFKLVGFSPGNGKAAVGQSFTQAHYCLLYDRRVGESLWMANCHSVGKAEIPLPDSLREHSSAAAVYLRKTLSNVQLLHGPSPLLCSPAVSEGALGQPCGCCFLEQSFQVAGNCVLLCEGGSIIC